MEDYLHRVVGIYPTRAAADAAADELARRGLARNRITVLTPRSPVATVAGEGRADSDDVLKEVLREGAIGTAVGTLAGAVGTAAIAAANLTLFVASPVIGPLSMLGWGASLGAIVGGAVGATHSKGDVADLVRDALSSGQAVLVAHAATEEQATFARQIVGDSMAEPGTATGKA